MKICDCGAKKAKTTHSVWCSSLTTTTKMFSVIDVTINNKKVFSVENYGPKLTPEEKKEFETLFKYTDMDDIQNNKKIAEEYLKSRAMNLTI